MIVIQHIQTVWTKQSRGMPGAARRNSVPRQLDVPAINERYPGIFVHKATALESGNFQLMHETSRLEKSDKYWSFRFRKEADGIQVLFSYHYGEHGQPPRGAYQRPLFKIRTGEWGSFHINGRFASYSGQVYMQHFVNIGNMAHKAVAGLFSGEPDFHINKMAHLF